MTAPQLVLIDLAGIQNFIFQTDTILDAIGRSAMVEDLTDPAGDVLSAALQGSDSELLARGAGGLVAGAPSLDAARLFVALYTRAVLDQAPGITPEAAITDSHDAPVQPLLLRSRRHSADSPPGVPLHGVVRCDFTGRAATGTIKDTVGGTDLNRPVTAAVLESRQRGRRAHLQLQDKLSAVLSRPGHPALTMPTRTEDLGASEGVSSHVAVIVADFNDLGDRISGAVDAAMAGREPGERWRVRHVLGDLLRDVADELFSHLVRFTAQSVTAGTDGTPRIAGMPEHLSFPLRPAASGSGGGWFVPLRPVLAAGDDMVIVCESRIAWSLSEAIMAFFDQTPAGSARAALAEGFSGFSDRGRLNLTVGLGLSVVPLGFSLRQAHDSAADLCKSAKARRRADIASTPGSGFQNAHVIDWQFGVGGPANRREAGESALIGRPYYRFAAPEPGTEEPPRSWSRLMQILDPATLSGLRSERSGEGTLPWSAQRSWLKSHLAESTPSQDSIEAAHAMRSARVLAVHAQKTIPGIDTLIEYTDRGIPAHRQLLLADALELLDEHLTISLADQPEGNQP